MGHMRNFFVLDLFILFLTTLIWTSGECKLKKPSLVEPKGFKISFSNVYGNHMVLQRAPKSATVWGFVTGLKADDVVKVFMGSQTFHASLSPGSNADEKIWSVQLAPMSGGGPYNIEASTVYGSATIKDVLFGDVWLCSGQSNMQFTMDMAFNATEELSEVHLYPEIRVFTAAMVWAHQPLLQLQTIDQNWSLPTNDSIGHKPWTHFSAVCWLYGKYLYQQLKYPVGLIASSWGGTPVESWTPPEALASCGIKPTPPGIHLTHEKVLGRTIGLPYNFGNGSWDSSSLWNAMIYPFVNMTIYGAIWYQGETNADSSPQLHRDMYNCTFPAMIDSWRKHFSTASGGETDSMFPFGFVQIGTTSQNDSSTPGWPVIRWHQTADYGDVPNKRMKNVFMAVAMDLPDPTSPWVAVHTRDKQDVGHRLMLGGLAVAYGVKNIRFQGPYPTKVSVNIMWSVLNITYGNEKNIDVRNEHGFEVCCFPNVCNQTSNDWQNATIYQVHQNSIILSYSKACPLKDGMKALRYAWIETPCPFKKCAVYSYENELPGPPFIVQMVHGNTVRENGEQKTFIQSP